MDDSGTTRLKRHINTLSEIRSRPEGLGGGDGPTLGWLLLVNLVQVIGFVVLGLLALRLTTGPGITATPVWPAAGLSLLLVLRAGPWALPGLVIGSIATNLLDGLLQGESITCATHLGGILGAAFAHLVRVGLAWYLIRRFASAAFSNPAGPAMLPAVLACLLGCGVGGIIGASSLVLSGDAPPAVWPVAAWTWASGDAIGTLVLWPVLVPFIWPGRWSPRRRLLIALPALVALVAVLGIYAITRTSADTELTQQLAGKAQELAERLDRQLDINRTVLDATATFFRSSQFVDADEFAFFAEGVLRGRQTIQALAWVRHLPGGEREAFVQQMHRMGQSGFALQRQDPDGSLHPAADAPVHRVITYTAPFQANAPSHGVDLLQAPINASYYDEATRRRTAYTSAPFRLVQETGDQLGCVVARPLWLERRSDDGPPSGWVALALRLGDLVDGALPGFAVDRFALVLTDADGAVLVERRAHGRDYLDRTYSFPVHLPGRPLHLQIRPSSALIEQMGGQRAWWSLFSGALVVGVLGLLLLAVVERTDIVVALVHTKTAELEEANRALESARDLAESANRSKSDFLATMSHEIRTPLNGVLGTVDLLDETRLDTRQRDWLTTIKQSGEGLLRLINDILDLSKIEAGHLTLEDHGFNITELARNALALFAGKAGSTGIVLRSELDEQLPRRLRGDPARLRQVLMNLIGNAVKFTEVGEVILRIESLGVDMEDRLLVRFTVEDSGIGIPAEAVERIFQPFAQADSSTSRRFGGTGLGLAICRRLVDAMGGELTVASDPGKGSAFSFCVPLPADHATVRIGDHESSRFLLPVIGRRVLLVEDNPVNQRVALAMLERLGCAVLLANDGAQAVSCIRNRQAFDLVLMDCQMPEMDGFEATRAIRRWEQEQERTAHLPIIALTANAFDSDRQRCLAAGMDDFLAKPVTLDALRRRLGAWIGKRSAG